jgi:hypothetical protein
LNAADLGYQTEGRLVLTASIPAKTEAQHLEAGATVAIVSMSLARQAFSGAKACIAPGGLDSALGVS